MASSRSRQGPTFAASASLGSRGRRALPRGRSQRMAPHRTERSRQPHTRMAPQRCIGRRSHAPLAIRRDVIAASLAFVSGRCPGRGSVRKLEIRAHRHDTFQFRCSLHDARRAQNASGRAMNKRPLLIWNRRVQREVGVRFVAVHATKRTRHETECLTGAVSAWAERVSAFRVPAATLATNKPALHSCAPESVADARESTA
jgi:hypothetical protein